MFGHADLLAATLAREPGAVTVETAERAIAALERGGSHILDIVRRRLPADWAERYNITPVLIGTFVEIP